MRRISKKMVVYAFILVLLVSSFASPASAQFEVQKQVDHQAKENQPAIPFSVDKGDHPLYDKDGTEIDPNEKVRLIVEVDVKKNTKNLPNVQVEQVKKEFMKKRDDSSKVRHTYTSGFYGFSMETTMAEAEKIQAVNGVKDIRLAKTYEHTVLNSKDIVEAMNVWSSYRVSLI
ncbi:protease inhibitor I9 family protein [Sutcliffiella halmapala]|uniref:protease inhibitor I9 family protein n=1 Tax=Sutcliffiella halmapala TaxID=79882 RepID=UPI00099581FB|nr:protease inhibitor I9 family protein [Sutcliffiella halmapala]